MEKLNLVKILKDCPKGMELDCTMYENVTFVEVCKDTNTLYPIYCITTDENGNRSGCSFTKNGYASPRNSSKCVIFPKGKTTWEGFHRPFVDGDIVINKNNIGTWIGIYHKDDRLNETFSSYCYIRRDGIFCTNSDNNHGYYETRLATEEEKQKLFKAIQENGYKWNTETKTLEKLIKPKFKVGDIVQSKTDNNDKFTITNIDNNKFYYGYGKGHEFMIPVEKQDNWELVPNKTTKDMEENKINQMSLVNCDLDEVEIVLGDRFELKNKDGKYYAVRKKPIYPTTYNECLDVLSMEYATTDKLCSLQDKLNILGKLIICRNAYWKIAGEQMGLGKPWKPVWDESEDLYTIHTFNGEIRVSGTSHRNAILVFPTVEMRDAFFENFKDLIESCKELL